MHSDIVRYLEDFELKYFCVENIKIFFCFFVIASCLAILLNFFFKRQYYHSTLPSKKSRLFSPWGNLYDIAFTRPVKGISFNVYVLQVLMGYQRLFKDKSFYFFSLSLSPYIVITKAKAAEELISGSRNMEKAWLYGWLHPWLGTGLLTSHGSKWKSRRKLLTPSFHFEILKDFLPVFNEQSQLLVKLLRKETEQPWTDIIKPITLCSLDIICETTLGVSVGAQMDSESEYVQAVSRAAEVTMKRLTYPPYFVEWYFSYSASGSQFKKDVKLLHSFTDSVIDSKKSMLLAKKGTEENELKSGKKRKALIDLLLEEHIHHQTLTRKDIREEVDTFAFEGHDTTSMGMSWALYMIGLYKDVQEKVHEEVHRIFGDDTDRPVTTDDLKDLEYLDRVLKESQRLYPSVPFFGRKLSEDATICGTKVPKEVGVVIFAYALHRDESAFPNPEKFDPDRFLPENTAKRSPFAYIPFSAGPRNCIGQRFAIMEEKVVLTNILRHYTIESLDARDKVLVAPELVLRSAVPIRIKIRSRRPV